MGLLLIYRPQQDQCTAPVQALDAAVRSFEPHLQTLASTLLRRLLTPGQMFPDLAQPLAELEQATDWGEAASTGRVVPAKVGWGMGVAGPAGSEGVPLSLHAEKGMGCQLWPPPGTGAVQQSHATPDSGPPLGNVVQAVSVVCAPPAAYLCCCVQPLSTVLDVDSTSLRQRRG